MATSDWRDLFFEDPKTKEVIFRPGYRCFVRYILEDKKKSAVGICPIIQELDGQDYLILHPFEHHGVTGEAIKIPLQSIIAARTSPTNIRKKSRPSQT